MGESEKNHDEEELKPKVAKQKLSITSRGVPAEESLYFPRYDSEELRNFQDKDENSTVTSGTWKKW